MKGTSFRWKRATSSTTSASRVTSRARQVGTVTFQSSATSKPRPVRMRRCSWSASSSPISSFARSGRKRTTGRSGQVGRDLGLAGEARAGQLEDQLGREVGGGLGQVRVDALLPAARALGAQAEPLGAPEDRERLEVRRLEQDGGRGLVDLAVLRAHDPGERDRLRRVGDHEVGRLQRALLAVERADLLALRGPADDDAALVELGRGRTRAAGCRARASRSWSRRRCSRSGACRRRRAGPSATRATGRS